MFESIVKTNAKLAVHLSCKYVPIPVGDMSPLVEIVLYAAYVTPEFGEFGRNPFLHYRVDHALPDILCRGHPGLSGLGQKVELLRRADFQSEAVTPLLCGWFQCLYFDRE